MTDQVRTLDPRRTALLVMDIQHGIVTGVERALGAESARVLDAAERAVTLVRERGGRIGHVRVAFTDEDLDAMPETSAMARAVSLERRPSMHPDHPGTAFHDRLAPAPGDVVVRKTRVGAFSTTDLDAQLRAAGVTTLLLAGLSTSGVVLSTVRDAADRDYRVLVLADACADPVPHVHDFLVEHVFPKQADVVRTGDLAALFSPSARP